MKGMSRTREGVIRDGMRSVGAAVRDDRLHMVWGMSLSPSYNIRDLLGGQCHFYTGAVSLPM